ncbi:UPF0175 family protein [Methanoplanus limicola]|uniref:UPF0175 family protein n=1 Tax=Methanoplanus limicola TaxID=2315 RepID=UPI001FE0D6ED|nr:UPF0175 family protein [Methanoplanus limicola]
MSLPPDNLQAELKQEFALAPYQRGILPSGKTCELAEMKRWEFRRASWQKTKGFYAYPYKENK